MTHRRLQHSRPQRSAPGAFGPSSRFPQESNSDCPRTGVRPQARQTRNRQTSQISASTRAAFGRGRAARLTRSMTNWNRTFRANARPISTWRCTSDERISRRKQVRVQTDMAVCGKGEIAALAGDLERTPQDIAAGPDMSRPRYDVSPEVFVGPGLEALQLALFDQLVAEPTKSKAGRIVAEARPGNIAKRHIVVAGTVAVASLEAEIDRTGRSPCTQDLRRYAKRPTRASSEHRASRGRPGRSSGADQ